MYILGMCKTPLHSEQGIKIFMTEAFLMNE